MQPDERTPAVCLAPQTTMQAASRLNVFSRRVITIIGSAMPSLLTISMADSWHANRSIAHQRNRYWKNT